MEIWKMIFLFNGVIFRFHVNFQGVPKMMGLGILVSKRLQRWRRFLGIYSLNLRGVSYPVVAI